MKKKKKVSKTKRQQFPQNMPLKAYEKLLSMFRYKEGTTFSLRADPRGEWEIVVSIPVFESAFSAGYEPFVAYSKIRSTTDPFEIASHVLSIIIHAESEVARFFFKFDGQSLPQIR